MIPKDTQEISLQQDLNAILTRAKDDLRALNGARLFLTGGTGFIGTWLLETFHHAVIKDGLSLEIVILTRDPERFRRKAPYLAAQRYFHALRGDVLKLPAIDGEFSHVIHGATDASAALNATDPRRMFDTIVTGTRNVLELAYVSGTTRFLQLSSGAVYGRQPWDVTHVPECYNGAPDCTASINAYAEGKRAAEMLCVLYGQQFRLPVSIARIFGLIGPYMTLDIHFAVGNFIRDAMAGRAVTVQGDGRPCRSYLYAADLIVWLLALLVRGETGRAYNVGSSESISIGELAARISCLIGDGKYEILGQTDLGWNPGRYVPSTEAIERDLGVGRSVSLDDAIRRTAISNGWTL